MSLQGRNIFGLFWNETAASLNVSSPEQRLIVALIARAMMDFMDSKSRKVLASARCFIFSMEENEEWCLYWCLQHISDDPDHLRKSIQAFCTKHEGTKVFAKRHWVWESKRHKATSH